MSCHYYNLSALLPVFGPLAGISSCCSWKKWIVTPKAVKLTRAMSLVSWSHLSTTVGAKQGTVGQASHWAAVTAPTTFKPRFLMDIYSHLGTAKGNTNVSPWNTQVLLTCVLVQSQTALGCFITVCSYLSQPLSAIHIRPVSTARAESHK